MPQPLNPGAMTLEEKNLLDMMHETPNNTAYILYKTFNLKGTPNKATIHHALQCLFDLYAYLRVSYEINTRQNDTPEFKKWIHPAKDVTPHIYEHFAKNFEDAEQKKKTFCETPFDLTKPPLLSAILIHYKDKHGVAHTIFGLKGHHLLFDGTAAGTFYLLTTLLHNYLTALKLTALPKMAQSFIIPFALLLPKLLIGAYRYRSEKITFEQYTKKQQERFKDPGSPERTLFDKANLDMSTYIPSIQDFVSNENCDPTHFAIESFTFSDTLHKCLNQLANTLQVSPLRILLLMHTLCIVNLSGQNQVALRLLDENRNEVGYQPGYFAKNFIFPFNIETSWGIQQLLSHYRTLRNRHHHPSHVSHSLILEEMKQAMAEFEVNCMNIDFHPKIFGTTIVDGSNKLQEVVSEGQSWQGKQYQIKVSVNFNSTPGQHGKTEAQYFVQKQTYQPELIAALYEKLEILLTQLINNPNLTIEQLFKMTQKAPLNYCEPAPKRPLLCWDMFKPASIKPFIPALAMGVGFTALATAALTKRR